MHKCVAYIDTLYLLNLLLHRNLHGKRPADYAVSLEMLEIFQEASKGTQSADTSLNPSASFSAVCLHEDVYNFFIFSRVLELLTLDYLIVDISKLCSYVISQMSERAKRGEMVVFLASKLSQTEQHQLAKLGELLGGRIADTFSGSGSVCSVQKHLLGGRGGLHLFAVSGKAFSSTGHTWMVFNVGLSVTLQITSSYQTIVGTMGP